MPRIAPAISDICEGEHFVEFYEDEARFIHNLTNFVGAGIKRQEVSVVIATADHVRVLNAALQAKGIDVAGAQDKQIYIVLDAAVTLASFAPNGLPDREKFRDLIDPLLAESTKDGRKMRAFGEMVALLWAQGNEAGAVILEQLWNDAIRAHPVTLFCAYSAHHFANSMRSEMLREVGRLHSSTIATGLRL